MFNLAFLIGIYSYIIFCLGLFGILYKPIIISTSIVYFIVGIFLLLHSRIKRITFPKNKFFYIFLALLVLQTIVSLVGALGPELGFDALWYHLTLPKIYLESHKIFSIPSSLFYYSDMPKLIEMIYVGALSFGSGIIAKCIHFFFGLLCCFTLFKLARKFVSPFLALVCVAIFYGNLVVGWESITAYIDLGRTFFEIVAFSAFIVWMEQKKEKYLYFCALLTGFAITAKILAFGSLGIFLLLIFLADIKGKAKKITMLKHATKFIFLAILIPFPWIIFSYVHTGDPFYPFFTSLYPASLSINLMNPFNFLHDIWVIFMDSPDPISPIYFISLPIIIFNFWKFTKNEKFIGYYSLFAILVWYITPRTGGGRFLLPYLPGLSLFIIISLKYVETFSKKIVIACIFLLLIISIGYRSFANIKYLPFVLGKETNATFLSKNLNFSFGDFYDTDGFFAKNIKKSDTVLLIGFHNLYYVNFPYTLSGKRSRFTYIATQHTILPKTFENWKIIYTNMKTGVTVYKM